MLAKKVDEIQIVVRSTFLSRKRKKPFIAVLPPSLNAVHMPMCTVMPLQQVEIFSRTLLCDSTRETDVKKLKVKLPKQELLFHSAL